MKHPLASRNRLAPFDSRENRRQRDKADERRRQGRHRRGGQHAGPDLLDAEAVPECHDTGGGQGQGEPGRVGRHADDLHRDGEARHGEQQSDPSGEGAVLTPPGKEKRRARRDGDGGKQRDRHRHRPFAPSRQGHEARGFADVVEPQELDRGIDQRERPPQARGVHRHISRHAHGAGKAGDGEARHGATARFERRHAGEENGAGRR